MTILTTDRLRLEPFDDSHVDGLNTINSDPEVTRYVGGCAEARDETVELVERVKARWVQFGFSWWTFIERADGALVGAGCIQNLRRDSGPPDPACPLEVGWRLRRDRWHRGLATEAAVAMADFAFDVLRADVLLAVCHPHNAASAAVMRRLGMSYRGIESWYGKELATYAVTSGEWEHRAAPPAAAQQDGAGGLLLRDFRGARVLLAEDDPVGREVARYLLESAGLTVELAETGAEAVRMAAAAQFDLILTDMQMPELDGLQAAAAIRSLPAHASTPILALTANAFDEDRRRCLEVGMNDFLAKPFEARLLFETLLKWLSVRRQPARPALGRA